MSSKKSGTPRAPATPALPLKESFLKILFLGALIAIVFYPSLKIPFLLDDYQIYLDHWPSVSWHALLYDVTHHFQQNRLLTHISWYAQLVMESQGPPQPYWFHWVNMAFHWINSILVFYFVRALGASPPVSFLTSVCFAIHPSNMETVSYIYGRSDLQVTALLLGVLMALKDGGRILWAGFLVVAAVLTKETAVVLPALYLMVTLVLKARPYPFHKISMALTFFGSALSLAGFVFFKTDHADNFGYQVPHAMNYLMLQPVCLFLGLIRVVVPVGFSIVYQFDLPEDMLDFRILGSILFWIVLVYFCRRQYKKNQPVYLFALGWYLAAMAPTNSIVPRIDQISDRHLYLALIGPFWALSKALEDLRVKKGLWVRPAVWAAVILCAGLTYTRNVSWQSGVSVWTEALHRFPKAHLARRELAAEYGRRGEPQKELEELEYVTKNFPQDWTSWNNLGVSYAAGGRREEEQHAYLQAIQLAPQRHRPSLYHNLAFSYQNSGKLDQAMETYRAALREDPHYVNSKNNLAVLLWKKGDTAQAERLLGEVLKENPYMTQARRILERIHQK